MSTREGWKSRASDLRSIFAASLTALVFIIMFHFKGEQVLNEWLFISVSGLLFFTIISSLFGIIAISDYISDEEGFDLKHIRWFYSVSISALMASLIALMLVFIGISIFFVLIVLIVLSLYAIFFSKRKISSLLVKKHDLPKALEREKISSIKIVKPRKTKKRVKK